MSLAIGPNAECLFTCDQCGELITALRYGAFLHPTGQSANIYKLLTIHGPVGDEQEYSCWEAWHAANPGQRESDGLATFLSLIGASYPDFKGVVRLAAKQAGCLRRCSFC